MDTITGALLLGIILGFVLCFASLAGLVHFFQWQEDREQRREDGRHYE